MLNENKLIILVTTLILTKLNTLIKILFIHIHYKQKRNESKWRNGKLVGQRCDIFELRKRPIAEMKMETKALL